jgi:hypothetical protein
MTVVHRPTPTAAERLLARPDIDVRAVLRATPKVFCVHGRDALEYQARVQRVLDAAAVAAARGGR